MSCPDEIDIENLAGIFRINKSLTDDLEELHILQGATWLARKVLQTGTTTMNIKKIENAETGVAELETVAKLTGGIVSSLHSQLDWTPTLQDEGMFGHAEIRTRYFTTLDMQSDGTEEDLNWLRAEGEWIEDENAKHIQVFVTSISGGWTMEQVWGFEQINGQRYHTRRVVSHKGTESAKVRFVCDYVGPN